MGAIVDIVQLDKKDIDLIKQGYPSSVIRTQSQTEGGIQPYRVIIPNEDPYDDSYYYFLFDNFIAMSSRNFEARLAYDEKFRERIKARAAENGRKMGSVTPKD